MKQTKQLDLCRKDLSKITVMVIETFLSKNYFIGVLNTLGNFDI